jgi:hypothetical protein
MQKLTHWRNKKNGVNCSPAQLIGSKEGIRGKLVLTPSEEVKVTLAADYLNSDDTIPVACSIATARQPI